MNPDGIAILSLAGRFVAVNVYQKC